MLIFYNVYVQNFQVKDAIFKTLIRNGMFDNSHIRLSLTRGKKVINFFLYLSLYFKGMLIILIAYIAYALLVELFSFIFLGYFWNEPDFQSLWMHFNR